MSFKFPEFTPPADLLPVGLFLMLQPKKSGKSTIADLLCNCLVSAGYDIFVLRNDEHRRFDRYTDSHRIELATTSDAIEGRISLDLDRHEIMIDKIGALSNQKTVIVYDSSAAAGERLPTVLYRDLYAAQFAEQGRSIVCFVPLRPTDDVASGALYAMEAAETALPGALIVPVLIAPDVDIEQLPREHDFFKCLKRARHGMIRLEHFQPAVMFHVDRLTVPLSEFTDPTCLKTRRLAREMLGCPPGQAGLVVAAVADLVATMEIELGKLNIGLFDAAAE